MYSYLIVRKNNDAKYALQKRKKADIEKKDVNMKTHVEPSIRINVDPIPLDAEDAEEMNSDDGSIETSSEMEWQKRLQKVEEELQQANDNKFNNESSMSGQISVVNSALTANPLKESKNQNQSHSLHVNDETPQKIERIELVGHPLEHVEKPKAECRKRKINKTDNKQSQMNVNKVNKQRWAIKSGIKHPSKGIDTKSLKTAREAAPCQLVSSLNKNLTKDQAKKSSDKHSSQFENVVPLEQLPQTETLRVQTTNCTNSGITLHHLSEHQQHPINESKRSLRTDKTLDSIESEDDFTRSTSNLETSESASYSQIFNTVITDDPMQTNEINNEIPNSSSIILPKSSSEKIATIQSKSSSQRKVSKELGIRVKSAEDGATTSEENSITRVSCKKIADENTSSSNDYHNQT
ncbi:unnamed protein product [Anisakis simplex]|uniref:Shugoshin_C domain-containing protein n=1 Tax=Anisakis simplex TaxID=6269 RepID=A0A0M3K5X1_ANISI|nr:unnamed protein product [Anisakis simplex]